MLEYYNHEFLIFLQGTFVADGQEKICYTESMVDGTKQYRGKNSKPAAAATPTTDASPETPATGAPNATNLDRRAWFSSLIPSMGDGLVKILRASNNLKRDVHEAIKEKADDLFDPSAPKK